MVKKWRKEGMCPKCGRVKTHAGMLGSMLKRKLVSGSRIFWFRSLTKKFSLERGRWGGVLKKI